MWGTLLELYKYCLRSCDKGKANIWDKCLGWSMHIVEDTSHSCVFGSRLSDLALKKGVQSQNLFRAKCFLLLCAVTRMMRAHLSALYGPFCALHCTQVLEHTCDYIPMTSP